MRTSGGLHLGLGYTWAEDYLCPWQLLAFDENLVCISGSSLDRFALLGTRNVHASFCFWSPDGTVLYTTECPFRLLCFDFGQGNAGVQIRKFIPRQWQSKSPRVFHACPALDNSAIYCLVEFQESCEQTLWRVSMDGETAVRLLPNRVFGRSSCLFQSSQHTFIATPNSPNPGCVVIHATEEGVERTYQLATSKIRLSSFSPFWRYCLFSTYEGYEKSGLWSFDFQSGRSLCLPCGSCGSWSPNGDLIAAVQADEELLLLDPDGTVARSVVSTRPAHEESCLPLTSAVPPLWSPDGNWLVFCISRWTEGPLRHVVLPPPSRLTLLGQYTFVLDVRRRRILSLFPSYSWAWRPRSEKGIF
jgi:hypothetical protein